MGHDWISQLEVDLKTTHLLHTPTPLKNIQEKYSNVFSEENRLHERGSRYLYYAKPKFYKARTVPMALKEKVEQKLSSLQSISPVQFSPWASPIVP